MAFGFNKQRYSPIAIDFGADSLKLLQIVPTNPPQLVAAGAATVPEQARTNSGQRYTFLAEAMKNLLATQPFKGRRAMLSIPAFQTLVQHLEIAAGPHENLEAQIGLHLQQRLNVDPSRTVVRHYPVTQVVREGGTQQELICLAASREAVMRYIDLARRCKLDIVGMHGEPLCLLKSFGHMQAGGSESSGAVCYIDIGSATTKVVIAHGSKMVFSKLIHAAGDQMTRHYATQKQVGFMEARSARISHAMGIETPALASISAGVETIPALIPAHDPLASEATSRAWQATDNRDETLECLIDELQLCLRYYSNLFPQQEVTKLVFLGGESMHKEICQSIARTVHIAAQLGDPFARLMRIGKSKRPTGVNLEHPQPGWAVPMGLCVRESNL